MSPFGKSGLAMIGRCSTSTDTGITLHHSLPPVTKRQVLLPRKVQHLDRDHLGHRPTLSSGSGRCVTVGKAWDRPTYPRSLGTNDHDHLAPRLGKNHDHLAHNPIVRTSSLTGSCKPVPVDKTGIRSAPKGARNYVSGEYLSKEISTWRCLPVRRP